MADEQQAPPAGPAYQTFEDILNLTAITEQDILVPGWGTAPVRLRPLSVAELQEIGKDAKGDNMRAAQLLIARSLVRPAFTEAQAALLWTRAAGPVKALVDVVNRMNGMGAPTEQQAQADATEHAFRA